MRQSDRFRDPQWSLAAMTPDMALAAWRTGRPAILPLGAIEWHGPVLPLGLDQVVAEEFSSALAAIVCGVLLPPLCLPITTLPHPLSMDCPTEFVRGAWRSVLDGLAGQGCQRALVVSGHYAQGHMVELAEACLAAMDRHSGLACAPGTPLELLGDPSMLDHAGRWEASQLLHLAPELVPDLGSLKDGEGMARTDLSPREYAVLGENPALGSPSQGAVAVGAALEAWASLARQLENGSQEPARERCRQAIAANAEYKAAWFRESWEQAIRDWWAAKG